jgi:hypothetical protein
LRALAALFAAALLGACSSATEPMSDWERQHRDLLAPSETAAAPPPPPYPRPENLIEFYLSATADQRYFIDAASLSALWKQGEVRYVLVARSPSGVENVSFEAIRCSGLYRVLATGNADRTWNARPSGWREIPRRADLSVPSLLKRQFFCPHNDPIQSSAEGVDALRRGAHPLVYVEQENRGR